MGQVASGCADSVRLNPKQEGRVKIALRKTAVDHLLVLIVYGEFESMMQIKPTGSTQYDSYSQSLAGESSKEEKSGIRSIYYRAITCILSR